MPLITSLWASAYSFSSTWDIVYQCHMCINVYPPGQPKCHLICDVLLEWSLLKFPHHSSNPLYDLWLLYFPAPLLFKSYSGNFKRSSIYF
jgi:hypothetical protein